MTNKNKLENFEDLLLGKFLDPIHGVIRITKLEKKIIDHPLFQRLRDIRQNTFLYKVFPSAMHSRFEHSVLMNPLMILVKIIKLRWIHILSYDQMVSRKINN
ncbi:phosphohydrolase, partial [Escherichia coli]|nr:phosphohydrolase [Escherichia coli]